MLSSQSSTVPFTDPAEARRPGRQRVEDVPEATQQVALVWGSIPACNRSMGYVQKLYCCLWLFCLCPNKPYRYFFALDHTPSIHHRVWIVVDGTAAKFGVTFDDIAVIGF
jgi:hypothetical protein